MIKVTCPECARPLQIDPHSRTRHQVTCPHCNTKSIVVSEVPLELHLATDVIDDLKKNSRLKVTCPECNRVIKLRTQVRRGQRITCKRCQTILEVIHLDPVELDVAFHAPPKQTRQNKVTKRKRTQRQSNRDWQ